ncbi:MAG: hypothetical protein ACR2IF_07370 [Terriglobales bacterium]
MWRLVAQIAFAIASFLGLIVHVQQLPAQVEPAAASILAQALVASGANGAIQDTVATGNIAYWDGRSGTITIKTKKDSRFRFDTTIDGKVTTSIVNAGKGRTVQGGTRRQLPMHVTQYLRAEHVPAFSRIADYQQPHTKATYVGLESVSGRPAHHLLISATPSDNTPADIEDVIAEFHVFIDSSTLLVVKTITNDFSPEIIENRTKVETYYSDFRPVAGMQVPYRIERYIRDRIFSITTLTNVAANTGVPDSDFQ